jgi:glycosyltransferase involved in cell wall biosynthesis
MNKLRVLAFHNTYSGGARLSIKTHLQGLERMGCDVLNVWPTSDFRIVSTRDIEQTLSRSMNFPLQGALGANAEYEYFRRVTKRNADFIRDLAKKTDAAYVTDTWLPIIPLLSELGVKVVHHVHTYGSVCPFVTGLHNAKAGGWCGEACTLSKFIKCKFRSRIEWTSANGGGSRLTRAITIADLARSSYEFASWRDYAYGYENVDVSICVSHDTQIRMSRARRNIARKTRTVLNPLPSTAVPVETTTFNSICGLYMGGVDYAKGFFVLVKALSMIRIPHLRMLFTKIPQRTLDEFKRLHRIENQLLSIGTPSLDELQRQHLPRVNLIVFPSIWHETLPYVPIEAVAYGKSLIATNLGGNIEATAGASSVKIVEPTSLALSQAIQEFGQGDIAYAAKHAAEESVKAREVFNREKVTSELYEILRS